MEVEELKREVRSVFDSLASRLGLSGPVEISMATTEFSLGYIGHNLGIQVTVEMNDFFIYVLLFRPAKGNGIPVGYTDDSGRTQKIHLQHALQKLSITTEQETQTLRKLAGNHLNCALMAKILADLLERHWPLLLANVEKYFPN